MNRRTPQPEGRHLSSALPQRPLYGAWWAPTHWEKPEYIFKGVLAHSPDHILRLIFIIPLPPSGAGLGSGETWGATPEGKSGSPGPHS